jgi:hypothetical protein
MDRQVVIALHPLAATGRTRALPSNAVLDSPLSPSPRASRTWQACPARKSSDGAVAAAVSGGWCAVEPGGLAATLFTSSAPVEHAEAIRAADGGRLITCGLWLARRRMVAAVLGREGEACRIIRSALSNDARFGLIEYLAAAGAEIVVTEALARMDLTPLQASRRGLAVWTIADAFAGALLRAAAIRDPARAAAVLARVLAIPLLRSSVRRLVLPDRRQLPLL